MVHTFMKWFTREATTNTSITTRKGLHSRSLKLMLFENLDEDSKLHPYKVFIVIPP